VVSFRFRAIGSEALPSTRIESMSGISYSRLDRAKSAFWRRLNDAVDVLRAPLRRDVVLLVTGNASDAKTSEVEKRLRFLFTHLEKTIEIRKSRRASPLAYLRDAGLAAADAAAVPAFVNRHVRWVTDLDYESNPLDGWELMDLGVALSRGAQRTSVAHAYEKFVDHVRRRTVGGPRPAYIFGTGPSLSLASERSFSDGAVIVCNTVVRDSELWHHLNPTFLTAGDAIYHFGHTEHARAFRADALKRLKESDGVTLFVYPAQFDVIVRSEFREVQPLLVPIPYGEHTDVSVDLTRRFTFPNLGNVLTSLLLPLACTLSTDVRLWGFDGRSPSDTGFWANSNRHAYPELMQGIRDAHPAFFADLIPPGKEVQYVTRVHGDLLEERLTDAESRGFQFRMLHPSWTPTLQKRYGGSDSPST
jgi:hypothetical protein